MVTHITLEDGRVLATKDWVFDAIIECVANELDSRTDAVEGLRQWLLDQRCEVQGPGVGYLDLREISPQACSQFKFACLSAYDAMKLECNPVLWLGQFSLLINMWISMDKEEPPEALTSRHWMMAPWSGERRGPGWE